MKQIVILATGGTIAGAAPDPRQTTGYRAGALPIAALMAALPDLGGLATVSGEQLFAIDSKDIEDTHWLGLARRIADLAADVQVDGIVVTHGTDTLEETAYFLNLVLRTDKPVVLVGAMRPATALSADGPMNLYAALRTAAADDACGKGVLVVMNDQISAAREVTKRHAGNVATFGAGEFGFLGEVGGAGPVFYRAPLRRHTPAAAFDIAGIAGLPAVEIVYGHAGMSPLFVDAAIAAGISGIVYAGTGEGSIHQAVLPRLAAAAAAGIAVVRASRTGAGRVAPGAAVDDATLGFVAADTLTPQKARILLRLGLTQTTDRTALQALFDSH
jgi:L-asparaginase